MKHIEYWLSEKDGEKFSNETDCMKHEVQLIEKVNGILYFDTNGNKIDNFDNAYSVEIKKELTDEDYKMLEKWYNWTIPNKKGVYYWDEDIEDWK